MSGHSKWSTIKRKKGKADAERGRLFTKLIRELVVAAREGGGDPESNPRLRTAVDNARGSNMPAANIEKAIKRGTGELPGVSYEAVTYEGYGPQGVAVMVEVLTDNKNRTTAEIRHILTKYGGNMGEVGCVSWMFHQKGSVVVEKSKTTEDDLMMVALDAGAEDVKDEGEFFEVVTGPAGFEKVKEALGQNGVEFTSAELTRVPQTTIKLEGKDAERILKVMDALEDNDDVQKVYSNFDVPDDVLDQLGKE
jgi:YebC/PmpR family DNA-binding regulatory protein